ncbi:DUF692 domain-containing protein [Novosphingobium sp. CECT 9465]|uniref:MNIO family bufferin maturase n=1 Tax=Novosphingobium sp. CECT 9465 TaxID=2829794 RepID=UPI001E3CB136|nr:DUF692 domain-containing protein [Novosphingobium sp. CECT 9465]CAH0495247.1 hypothetical protein NVSP9465_00253 [Novosphingobium sp. CECT 9465]
MNGIPAFHGFGLGLRREHYADFTAGTAQVDFVEIISENYMVDGGRPLAVLDAVRRNYPVAMHGVSLSVGSAQGLDREYLRKLKLLADRIEPLWISDHLCWTRTSAHNSHDLLPLPYTVEALDIVCANLTLAQDVLGRPLLLENPSSYCSFPDDDMAEWEFLSTVSRRTGCHLLLDINNVFVSAHNHGYAAQDFLGGIPMDAVRQIHLAGHTPGEILIDTHDRPVCDDVWSLFAQAISMAGPVATMIERDDAIPPLPELLAELETARKIAAGAQRWAA